MFKFTLRIATSVFLLMSGAADLFAMEPLDEAHSGQRTSSKALAPLSPEMCQKLDDVKPLIVFHPAFTQCLDNELPVNLALVCTDWFKIIETQMQVDQPCFKAWYGAIGHEDIYETFVKGDLLYRPNPDSDEGMITLKISELMDISPEGTSYKLFTNNSFEGTSYKLLKRNPLEGTFDLSTCGDTGQYLSISTGYRKAKKQENSNKLEIWLAPRFIIEKNLKSSAGHIQPIMGDWNEEIAPIGIFWTCGGWDNLNWYDYLSNKTLADIGSKNLYENWIGESERAGSRFGWAHGRGVGKYFVFICKPK